MAGAKDSLQVKLGRGLLIDPQKCLGSVVGLIRFLT